MKRVVLSLLSVFISYAGFSQIVANHFVVDRFDDIPAEYVAAVKKMWLTVPGESHSQAYRTGLELLEALYPAYSASVVDYGTPEAYTEVNLRASRATWGDLNNASGWIYNYGEEDWFTSSQAISRTEAGIMHCNTNGRTISAMGFGWCYDPDITDMTDYLNATQAYIDYCSTNGYPTRVFFTTGPVDDIFTSGGLGYINYLRYEEIRSYVDDHPATVFFDYADILCYNDGSATPTTATWNGHTYPVITTVNLGDANTGHIGSAGAIRLAKAMWWMLARIAGWNGEPLTAGTWLGGTTGNETDWTTATNWYGGMVPTPATDVSVSPSAVHQPVISSAAECQNLTILSGTSLTLNEGQSLTVNGDLSCFGTLTIDSDITNGSGSLIVVGSSAGNVTYNRTMPDDGETERYHYISSPVSLSETPAGFFYPWYEVTNVWGDPTTTVESGKGYTVKGGGSISFTGSLVTSDIHIDATSPYRDVWDGEEEYTSRDYVQETDGSHSGAVTRSDENYGGGGFNLLGNPFTSPIMVSRFLDANDDAFDLNYKAIYLYDGISYWYIGSPVSGWESDDPESLLQTHIQTGQGFFVVAMNDLSTFTFSRGMQDHDTDVPLLKSARTEDTWPGLRLKVKYGEKENSTLVIYNDQMTAGLDPGYDVGQMSGGSDMEIYTVLASKANSVNFARQALPVSGADTLIVPVGIDASKGGEVTFSASVIQIGNDRFWLEDRLTGTFNDLGSGTYTVTLPEGTYGTGRFFIHSSADVPEGKNTATGDFRDKRIWASDGRIIIKGNVSGKAICEVFNLQGQKILYTTLIDGELNIVPLPSSLHGVFLVRVTDGVKVTTTRKVALL